MTRFRVPSWPFQASTKLELPAARVIDPLTAYGTSAFVFGSTRSLVVVGRCASCDSGSTVRGRRCAVRARPPDIAPITTITTITTIALSVFMAYDHMLTRPSLSNGDLYRHASSWTRARKVGERYRSGITGGRPETGGLIPVGRGRVSPVGGVTGGCA